MEGVASFDMDTRRFTTLLSGKVDAMTYHKGLYIACGNEIFHYNKETGNFDSFFRLSSASGSISSLFSILPSAFGLARSMTVFIAGKKGRRRYIW